MKVKHRERGGFDWFNTLNVNLWEFNFKFSTLIDTSHASRGRPDLRREERESNRQYIGDSNQILMSFTYPYMTV